MAKNSTTILTGVGVVGVLATTVLTYKATEKTIEEIVNLRMAAEEADPDAEEIQIEKVDILKASWKHWIPVGATVGMTIAAIVVAHRINVGKLAALASAYKLSEDTRKNYKQAVLNKFGKNKAKDVATESHLIEATNALVDGKVPLDSIVSTGCGDQSIFLSFLGYYIRSSIPAIERQLADYSADLERQAVGEGCVYDMLEAIHIPAHKIPSWLQRATWVVDRDKPETYEIRPHFDSKLLDDGTAIAVLELDPDRGNMPVFRLA